MLVSHSATLIFVAQGHDMKIRGDEGEKIYRTYASCFGKEPWEALVLETRSTWETIGRKWMNDRKRSKKRRFRGGVPTRSQALYGHVVKNLGGPPWSELAEEERERWVQLADFRTRRWGRKARKAPNHDLKFGAALAAALDPEKEADKEAFQEYLDDLPSLPE
jgi:hypothetical protein